MDTLTVRLGENEVLLDRLLDDGVAIAHDCGGALACSSCAVVIAAGSEQLSRPSEDELDMLERGGVDGPDARLACQVSGAGELVIEIPGTGVPAPQAPLPVKVTPEAARFLSQQLAKSPGAVGVRLGAAPSGCSGFGYRIEPAHRVEEDDAVYETEGVRILVARKSLPFVQGTAIDLVQEGLARRLRFDNPNARQSCGCGESFSV